MLVDNYGKALILQRLITHFLLKSLKLKLFHTVISAILSKLKMKQILRYKLCYINKQSNYFFCHASFFNIKETNFNLNWSTV